MKRILFFKNKKMIFRAGLGSIIALIGISLYSNLTVKSYKIETNAYDAGEQIKILLITDLHSCSHGKDQRRLLKLIQKQEADLILMSGDIVDDKRSILGTKQLLEGLQHTVPIYYVTGNHEYRIRNIEGVKTFMRSYGVTVLEEDYLVEKIRDNEVVIGGMSDPYKWRMTKQRDSFEEAYNQLGKAVKKENGYKILLCHRPEYVDLYKEGTYDLVVSGHAHGGQVRIPGVINGLLAPNQGWFPKYAGGMYKLGHKTNLVVSRGLSVNWKLPRIFNPPELVVITLEGNREK